MEQALAVGSIVPAALGAGCCAMSARSNWVVIAAMGLMVVAMGDTMLLGEHLLTATGWAVVLIGAAVLVFVIQHGERLGVERAVHLGMMALLLVGMGMTHGDPPGPAGHSVHVHAHHGQAAVDAGSQPLGYVALLLAAAWSITVFARARSCVDRDPRSNGLVCAERVTSGVSLLAMALMVVV